MLGVGGLRGQSRPSSSRRQHCEWDGAMIANHLAAAGENFWKEARIAQETAARC